MMCQSDAEAGGRGSPPAPWPHPQEPRRNAHCPAAAEQWAGPYRTPAEVSSSSSRDSKSSRGWAAETNGSYSG
eukprot:1143774-Pelagomonas_calceolata.AAC.8